MFSLELYWIPTEYPKRYLFKVHARVIHFFSAFIIHQQINVFKSIQIKSTLRLIGIYESENKSCSSYLLGWLGSFVFLIKVLN